MVFDSAAERERRWNGGVFRLLAAEKKEEIKRGLRGLPAREHYEFKRKPGNVKMGQ